MASEITAVVKLQVAKGNLVRSAGASNRVTMSGTRVASGAMDIPTSAGGTAIPLGSVATLGVLFVRNLDATNYVTIGVKPASTFYPVVKLKPGEAWLFRLTTGIVPMALADTATCVLQYELIED